MKTAQLAVDRHVIATFSQTRIAVGGYWQNLDMNGGDAGEHMV